MKLRIHTDLPHYVTNKATAKDQNWCGELNPWPPFNHTESLFSMTIIGAAIAPVCRFGARVRLLDYHSTCKRTAFGGSEVPSRIAKVYIATTSCLFPRPCIPCKTYDDERPCHYRP